MADSATKIDFERLFQSAPANLLVVSPDFEVLAATDAFLKVTGTSLDEIVGRHVSELFSDRKSASHSEGRSYGANLIASLQRAKESLTPDAMTFDYFDVPLRAGAIAGSSIRRWWSTLNTPVLDSYEQLGYIVSEMNDVTDFVEATGSREFADHEQEGYAQSIEQSKALSAANEALRVAAEAKNNFLSRMSHELRTPLTAINGFSELLELAPLEREHARWAHAIRRAGTHLLELVDEVLDISRIESGKYSLSIEPVSVQQTVDEVIDLMTPLAESDDISLGVGSVSSGTYVLADAQRLNQVLINLISNAIKYNSPGGEVNVDVEAADDQVLFEIRDTGRGIAKLDLERIFIPFERVESTASAVPGTGLGLALTAQLVEAMDGTVAVDSDVDVGSKFRISLPKAEPVAIMPTEKAAPALDERLYDRPIKLLYVEDAVANVRLVREILKRRPNVELIPAMQGRLGLELAMKHRPDVVLLDLHLPDIGGREVLREFAQRPELSGIPVAILSADATRTGLEQLKQDGAKAYLTKPVSVVTLLEAVDELVDDALRKR